MIEELDECTLYLFRELCTRIGLDFDGNILPHAIEAISTQGKRYPWPKKRKSKMRMSKRWRACE